MVFLFDGLGNRLTRSFFLQANWEAQLKLLLNFAPGIMNVSKIVQWCGKPKPKHPTVPEKGMIYGGGKAT